MNPTKETILFDDALTLWGKEFQIMMAIEEMAELMQKLSHYLRKNRKVKYTEIASEIADVQIMMRQLIQIFCILDIVNQQEALKLNKLQQYIEKAKRGESADSSQS